MWAQSARFLTPWSWGSGIAKTAIVYDRLQRLFRPLGHIFWYVFAMDSHLSRAAVSRSPPSGDLDVFLPLLGSYPWYVNSPSLELYSHVLYID